jgi:tRNA-specific 2-thiouridylase
MTSKQETIAVAMSGGVDSSAVAALLRAEGYPIVGLTLQLWNQRRLAGREGMPESVQGRCCSIDDVYDARRVAEHLDIPYYLVNAQDRFEEEVVRPFVAEYLAGRTPIPCTLCNNHLKFDQLLVTTKDQTYFLFGLTQAQLSRTLFPLGGMQKPAVRAMAADHGLELAQKPDSQEICFIPGGSYSQFLKAYLDEQRRELPDSAGELVMASGEVVGQHAGIHGFTVGQRKGLGISSPDPLYVLKIHPDSHKVEVGPDTALLSRSLRADRLNWVSMAAPVGEVRVAIKIRHRHEPAMATLRVLENDLVEAAFDNPQRAITPGQSAVFYQGDEVAGGGWIV